LHINKGGKGKGRNKSSKFQVPSVNGKEEKKIVGASSSARSMFNRAEAALLRKDGSESGPSFKSLDTGLRRNDGLMGQQ